MFENVRADIRAVRQANQEQGWWKGFGWAQNLRALANLGVSVVIAYRFGHWATTVRVPAVRQVMLVVAGLLRRWVMVWTGGAFISPYAEIGPGLILHTTQGINVGSVKIGAKCTISSGVLISCGTRSVGDNVYFGAGCKVVGDARIGSNVVIMPNSLVLTDVADNTTIVGVPARIKLRGGRPQRFTPVTSAPPKPKTVGGNGASAPSTPNTKNPLEAEVKKN